ncbi:MAG: hypothetical protein SX243_11595 [Acidobacteriota bacterium]|nr:hypothetical protein [Acidobacteriota bacterium]
MSNGIKYGRTDDVTHEWTTAAISDLALPSGHDRPVVIAAMQTFNGSDTAGVRARSLSKRSFDVKIEEERSDDTEVRHAAETVGHIAFAPMWIQNSDHEEIGYAGFLDVHQPDADSWMALPIPTRFSVDDSVVFAQVLTYNGSQPVHPRIRKEHPASGAPGFYLKLEEWPTYDQRHAGERVGVVVLKKGVHALRYSEDPYLVVGELTNVNHTWQEVDLGNTCGSGRPVLVTHCQTYNGSHAVVTRQRETDPLKAEIRLQEAESQGRHKAESVGYVAMGVPLH